MCFSACRFINGLKAQGTKTKDAKVLFYGAGSSAVGVANMIATLIEKEGGLSEKEAKEVSLPSFLLRTCSEKKKKEKSMPFGVNLMRSQVLYRAA